MKKIYFIFNYLSKHIVTLLHAINKKLKFFGDLKVLESIEDFVWALIYLLIILVTAYIAIKLLGDTYNHLSFVFLKMCGQLKTICLGLVKYYVKYKVAAHEDKIAAVIEAQKDKDSFLTFLFDQIETILAVTKELKTIFKNDSDKSDSDKKE